MLYMSKLKAYETDLRKKKRVVINKLKSIQMSACDFIIVFNINWIIINKNIMFEHNTIIIIILMIFLNKISLFTLTQLIKLNL